MPFVRYFASLRTGKLVLWCYLIWYLVNTVALFDPAPFLWLNSAGISLVIGVALLLSVTGGSGGWPDRWQIFRLFLMPFCVSSFAALIKGRGYIIVFPSDPFLLALSVLSCVAFVMVCTVLRFACKAAPSHHAPSMAPVDEG